MNPQHTPSAANSLPERPSGKTTVMGSAGSPCWAFHYVAALFVETDGCYFNLPGVDPWDIRADARMYRGPHPVVAHPPCHRWGKLGANNYKRWGGEHNRPGNDAGCFYAAINAVHAYGGVLEHPAMSHAWSTFGLPKPIPGRWWQTERGWVCQVAQSAYGHKARKLTWLYYVGPPPPDMAWHCPSGTHQVGFHDQRGKDRNKPTLSKRDANMTPPLFRDALLSLARLCWPNAKISGPAPEVPDV